MLPLIKEQLSAPANALVVLVMHVFEYDREKFKVMVENYYKDMIACDSCVRVKNLNITCIHRTMFRLNFIPLSDHFRQHRDYSGLGI